MEDSGRQRGREMCKVWEEVCNEWEIHRKFFSTVLELGQEACFLLLEVASWLSRVDPSW
jgi:hypothetical protein